MNTYTIYDHDEVVEFAHGFGCKLIYLPKRGSSEWPNFKKIFPDQVLKAECLSHDRGIGMAVCTYPDGELVKNGLIIVQYANTFYLPTGIDSKLDFIKTTPEGKVVVVR